MSCDECPFRDGRRLEPQAIIDVLWRCDHCPVLRDGEGPAAEAARALAAAMVELGQVLRHHRRELHQLESNRDELVAEAERFEKQLSLLERLHQSSSEELETQLELVRQQRDEIGRQRSEIRSLSTPLLEVGVGVLALPVIGVLSEERAQEMTYSLLTRIHANKIRKVIIDITGVAATDPEAVERMAHMLGSARLLGAQVFVTGISPGLAAALVAREVSFEEIRVVRTVREALAAIRDGH
ncbi:MAG: STAS domain-containing protein [Myxococcales bacterium]|nr:STAS domain-containing protein [Myxococcales bacterium]